MTCKANFVPTVKEIMPRQGCSIPACGRIFATRCASEAQKDLDRTFPPE